MDFKNTQDSLQKFAKYVIQQSRGNLTRAGKGKGELYNSLSFEYKQSADMFSLSLFMADYGKFQDQGVKGSDPSKVSKNAKITGQQAPNSPYRFGSGTHRGTWSSFTSSLKGWVASKNLRLRDEKGRYKKGDYQTIANIVARNIYARGIKPSMFFTRPFDKAWETLPDAVVEAYGIDMDGVFEYLLK